MKRAWLFTFIAAIAIFILLDLLLSGRGHAVFPWSRVTGFFALFGLLGCLALIGFAKLLGHFWLQRRDDYYGKDDDTE